MKLSFYIMNRAFISDLKKQNKNFFFLNNILIKLFQLNKTM